MSTLCSSTSLGSVRALGARRVPPARDGVAQVRTAPVAAVCGSRSDLMNRAASRLRRMEEGWKPADGYGAVGTSKECLVARVEMKAARYGVRDVSREAVLGGQRERANLDGAFCTWPRFPSDEELQEWAGTFCSLPRFKDEGEWRGDYCEWPQLAYASYDSFDEQDLIM